MYNVYVLRAAGDVQSDHHLVIYKVKVKLEWSPPRLRGEIREFVKVERPKDEGCKEVFERGIREEWLGQKEREIGSVEEEWLAFKNAVIKCAGGACGMRKLSKRGIRKGRKWWNEELERLVRMKMNMYKVWLQDKCNKNYDRYRAG